MQKSNTRRKSNPSSRKSNTTSKHSNRPSPSGEIEPHKKKIDLTISKLNGRSRGEIILAIAMKMMSFDRQIDEEKWCGLGYLRIVFILV